MTKKDIGHIGEEYVLRCLLSNEFDILDRNVRLGRGELDIVTQRDGDLHVFEVKTAMKDSTVKPEENLHRRKQIQLRKLSGMYIARSGFTWRDIHIHGAFVYISPKGKCLGINFVKDLIIEA